MRFRGLLIVLPLVAGGVASAQDAAATAAELLAQLRAAGVEIPEGFVANEDGSVSLPAAPEAEAPPPGGGDRSRRVGS